MAKLSTSELLDTFRDMTLAEVTDFVKRFEETFDVSANTPIPLIPAMDVPDAVVEEQTEFDVILEAAGDKKIGVIKVVRELIPGVQLKEAKDLVDGAPKTVMQQVTKEAADTAVEKLKAAGATVTVR